MRIAATAAALALAAALLGACGSSGGSGSTATTTEKAGGGAPAGATAQSCVLSAGGVSGLRATGVSCGGAQKVALAWRRSAACVPRAGASRFSCEVGSYRCLGAATARGLAVGCARPGHSIAFLAKVSGPRGG
jgi:hypothetical protein